MHELKDKKQSYSDKLKSPQWQKKRLEIFNLRGFKCECCGAEDKELHVHHRFYIKGREVWEYDNDVLMVLCHVCHEKEHEKITVNKGEYEQLKSLSKLNGQIYLDFNKILSLDKEESIELSPGHVVVYRPDKGEGPGFLNRCFREKGIKYDLECLFISTLRRKFIEWEENNEYSEGDDEYYLEILHKLTTLIELSKYLHDLVTWIEEKDFITSFDTHQHFTQRSLEEKILKMVDEKISKTLNPAKEETKDIISDVRIKGEKLISNLTGPSIKEILDKVTNNEDKPNTITLRDNSKSLPKTKTR